MAASYTQSNSATSVGADYGVAFSSALTSGSLLVASVYARVSSSSPTLSDTATHTWTLRTTQGPVFAGLFDAWYWVWTAPNTGTATPTVNFDGTYASGGQSSMIIVEVGNATYESIAADDSNGVTSSSSAGDGAICLAFMHDVTETSTALTNPTPTFSSGGGGVRHSFGYQARDTGQTLAVTSDGGGFCFTSAVMCASSGGGGGGAAMQRRRRRSDLIYR